MRSIKIQLRKEKETLLVPLYCRALETRKSNPKVMDLKALEILDQLDYDFGQLGITPQNCSFTCQRARLFDEYTLEFIHRNPRGTVIYLGCGLDSRFNRVDNRRITWYDLDFPDVIRLRKEFYKENNRYHMIASPVSDLNWINKVLKRSGPVLILAEGLFMYLREAEARSLLLGLQNAFPGCRIVFDCFGSITARDSQLDFSIRKTGAAIRWWLDDSKRIEGWGPGIRLIEEKAISSSTARVQYQARTPLNTSRSPKPQRILCFELG
ncbi:MAG: class I SAM-dependent methyltransferase [Candidatus Saccharibacteria bacterium]